MARVTVADCLKVLENHFELAVLASYRAKEISKGSQTKEQGNNKCTVTALKEIAADQQGVESLRQAYIRSLQKNAQAEDVLEEDVPSAGEGFVAKEHQNEVKSANTKKSSVDESLEDEFVSVENYNFEDDEVESDH